MTVTQSGADVAKDCDYEHSRLLFSCVTKSVVQLADEVLSNKTSKPAVSFSIIINMSLAQEIKAAALEMGFDLVGITDASPISADHVKHLEDWLDAGYAGQMLYMHRNLDKRINPAKLLPGAQSVIVVGLSYKPAEPKRVPTNPARPTGKVCIYAQYEDYHPFIKKHLRELARFIDSATGKEHTFKICVDSVPLVERALATRAGLGFIGKNHLLIKEILGPQIFLGEIVTTLKLATDKPNKQSCLDCERCLEACPTGALRRDGQFDATRCINYLTIEHKGEIPQDLAGKIGNRLFGCDECVLVCPYQQNAPFCRSMQLKFYVDRAELDLQEVLSLTAESFNARFGDSPIKRLGLDRLKRNAQICLGAIQKTGDKV
jgi:epoxyqueuosine reductase